MSQTNWSPPHIIAAGVLLFVGTLLILGLIALVSADVALLLLLVVFFLVALLGALAALRWLQTPQRVPANAAGVFPVLTTNAAGHLVVMNPNAGPGPASIIRPNGQVDLGGEFATAHLLAASRESRAVQATAALAQPGSAVPTAERVAAAARFAQLPPAHPIEELPPVRISTIDAAHVDRLLIEAGELEEA
ncbi:MAG: hypothetical protein KKA73_03005 [Chloroflexi bacterium]|nr:hypothetical protein [Chloroflexota bacterium]